MSTQQDATVNIHVNNQEAEEKVKELSARARQLRQEFAEAVRIGDKGTIAKTEKELKKVNKELNNATLRSARIRDAMKHLSQATPKELRNTLKLINQELNSGAVKRGSKEWQQYQQQLKQVNTELKKIQAETREVAASSKNRLANVANLAVAISSGMQIYDEVVGKLKGLVNAYAEHDAAMANTQKYTGMTREDVERLNEEFKKMDTRTSREGLNELAQAAGRLGKNSVEDVMGFVRAGDIIGVAMDELGAEAPQIISQLAGIFNLEGELGTEKAMLSVGSAINTLSQNCAAGAPNLVDFASRLGAIANSTNMSMEEMLAFGALLDDQKVSVEKASTAMQTVITKMYAEPAKFAKTAGLNVKDFTEALKRSSTEGIMMFVDQLSRMDSMQQAATLKELHVAGAGVVQTFQTLAGKTDLLRQQMDTSRQAFNDATSATEEFGVQNNTVQAELDKAKKGFTEMAVALGEKLYPVMKYTISGTSMLMRTMKSLIDFVSNNIGVIATLTAAIVAYHIAVQKAIIISKTKNAVTKTAIALKYAWTTATQLATSAISLFSGNIKKATAAFKAFSLAIKTDPIGLLVSAITLAGGVLINWVITANDATNASEKLKNKNENLKKSFEDLNNKTSEYANNELSTLKELYKSATKEANSKKERIKAASDLIKQYPEYFSKLTAEAIMIGEAKDKYDQLTNSIIKTARAKAALDMLKEEQKNLLSLQLQRDQILEKQNSLNNGLTVMNDASNDLFNQVYDEQIHGNITRNDNIPKASSLERAATMGAIESNRQKTKQELEELNTQLKEIDEKIMAAEDNVKWIESQASKNTPSIPPTKGTSVNLPTSDKERKKAEEEAKKALERDLEQKRTARDQEHASNLLAYSQGEIDYLKYTEEKHNIDIKAIEEQKKILENAKLTETEEYGKLLKKEAEMSAQHLRTTSQLQLEQLDRKKQADEDELTLKYLNNEEDVNNEKTYRQRLFQLDIEYLNNKKNLYTLGSKEYEDAQQELNERIKQDQIEKAKETRDALIYYQQEYLRKGPEERMNHELELLKKLNEANLISDEEYNKAKREITKKYEKDEVESAREVQSEYADLVVNLYTSFKSFFDELGKDGSKFWNNLANASQAAFSIMSTALGQYAAYANAERDLEIAKVEKRYDAEIEKAGKNSKKKEQLEKEKEAEIAKIKKKHNEKSMKIEIAQAIAQTASAAIAAYASAAYIPVTGWIMAPIAAALALAAGAMQIATIRKQHQAQAMGYYEGGFTNHDINNHKEVGVVHANEFVANHKAVANPQLKPLFNLIDSAQRNNTVGRLTANDVSNAIGQGGGVIARAEVSNNTNEHVGEGLAIVGATLSSATGAIDRLNKRIDEGIETVMIMDGERGFARKYEHYLNLKNKYKR